MILAGIPKVTKVVNTKNNWGKPTEKFPSSSLTHRSSTWRLPAPWLSNLADKGICSDQVNKGSLPWPTNWALESYGESILLASVTVLWSQDYICWETAQRMKQNRLSDILVSHLDSRNYTTEIKRAMKNHNGSLGVTHAFLMLKL